VDQVGEQRDRAGEREDRELDAGGEGEDGEAGGDRLDAGAGADDRALDESVRVPVLAVIVGMVRALERVLVVAQEASSIRCG
jgi:hypothetical protein